MKTQTNYPDGRYTLNNRHGIYTEVNVKDGLVFVIGGLADGRTGATLEHYEKRGVEILPFVIVPSDYSEKKQVAQ